MNRNIYFFVNCNIKREKKEKDVKVTKQTEKKIKAYY